MVLDLLHSNDRQQQLAAPNAMVVLNIWMEVVDKVRLSCFVLFSCCFESLIIHHLIVIRYILRIALVGSEKEILRYSLMRLLHTGVVTAKTLEVRPRAICYTH